jgi:cell division protein FtsQ
MWLRGSSLVAVDHVTVTGLQGPTSGGIRAALQSVAKNMTTLEVNRSALHVAVAPFPVVKSLQVSTQFPHGMRIRVIEQGAVGVLTVDGRKIPVAANGTLLPAARSSGLPSIPVSVPPAGAHVSSADALGAVALLGAAPAWLRDRVQQVSTSTQNGLVAQMSSGPEIYFGDATMLRAKWTAAVTVLANLPAGGAQYIDVSVPDRPAAGGLASTASSDQSSSTGTSASSNGG